MTRINRWRDGRLEQMAIRIYFFLLLANMHTGHCTHLHVEKEQSFLFSLALPPLFQRHNSKEQAHLNLSAQLVSYEFTSSTIATTPIAITQSIRADSLATKIHFSIPSLTTSPLSSRTRLATSTPSLSHGTCLSEQRGSYMFFYIPGYSYQTGEQMAEHLANVSAAGIAGTAALRRQRESYPNLIGADEEQRSRPSSSVRGASDQQASLRRQSDPFQASAAEEATSSRPSSNTPFSRYYETSLGRASTPFASSSVRPSTPAILAEDPRPNFFATTIATRPQTPANPNQPPIPTIPSNPPEVPFPTEAILIPDPTQPTTIGATPLNTTATTNYNRENTDIQILTAETAQLLRIVHPLRPSTQDTDQDDITAALLPPTAPTPLALINNNNNNPHHPAIDTITIALHAAANPPPNTDAIPTLLPRTPQTPATQRIPPARPGCRLYSGRDKWLTRGTRVAQHPLPVGEACPLCRAVFKVQEDGSGGGDAATAGVGSAVPFGRVAMTALRCGCRFHRECLWSGEDRYCPWSGMKGRRRGISE
ncbi:predicted protein [Plenodomus lingam JN3]|uniref:Predicted protein n=1 Tax=Leptosphaeria maculans (strain JN3 / isolate v23.1.3 / race Av1-4-5-6-7-8) TaxID=985895 RepID=E5A2R0_LEPMJ|nr:predicted protein [Plenodomus lingam JN3]CBX97856.1 predicted protein [Plenodomus lingam JN3]